MSALTIIICVAVFFVLVLGLTISKLLIICDPSEVVIFSGPAGNPDQKVSYLALRNSRRLRIPLLERVDRLDLTNMAVNVSVRGAYSQGGIPLNIDGVANIKIDGDPPGLDNAVERLLGKTHDEITRLARETLEGNLRGVLARLTPEQVNEDKESFAAELVSEAEDDLQKLGLRLDTLKIQTVADDSGYLDAIGRKKNAELLRNAKIAEAERKAESERQEAANLEKTRIAQVQAMREIAEAEAKKRILDAQTRRGAEVAKEESLIAAQLARAKAELDVQQARITQIDLQLDADLVTPAMAYREQREAQARAAVASLRENGEATARGLTELSRAWASAGDKAADIFLLEKLRALIGVMVGTVDRVQIDQLTVVGDRDSGGSTAGQVASLVEQLKSSSDIDIPKLLKGISLGVKATEASNEATETVDQS